MVDNLETLVSGTSEGNTKPLWDAWCREKFIPFAEAHGILSDRLKSLYERLTTREGYEAPSSSWQKGTDPLPECEELEDLFTAVRAPMNRLFDYYKALHDVNTNWSLRAANALHYNMIDAELAGRCFHEFLESFTKLYDMLNAINPEYMKDIIGNAEQYTSALVGVLETHQLQQRLPAGRYAQSAQGLIDGHKSIEIWRENKRSPESIREEIQDASYRLLQSANTIGEANEKKDKHLKTLERLLNTISKLTQNGNPVEELDRQRSFIDALHKLPNTVRNIHYLADNDENCDELFKQADRLLKNLWENFVFPADITPVNRVGIVGHLVDGAFYLYKDLSKIDLESNELFKIRTFLDENPVVHNPEKDPYLQSLPGQLRAIAEQVEEKCSDIPEWARNQTRRVTQYTIFAVAEWLESLGIETASWYCPEGSKLGLKGTLLENFLDQDTAANTNSLSKKYQ